MAAQSVFTLSLSPHALPYLFLCPFISMLQRSPEWIRDGINGMRRITNRFGKSVVCSYEWKTLDLAIVLMPNAADLKMKLWLSHSPSIALFCLISSKATVSV